MNHEVCLAPSVLEFIHLLVWAGITLIECAFSPCFLMPFSPEAKYCFFHLVCIDSLWMKQAKKGGPDYEVVREKQNKD